MKRKIPFYKFATKDIINSDFLSNIENDDLDKVKLLEDEVSDYIGAEYTVSCCNDTVAIHLALSAMDLKRADKVIMSVNSHPSLPESVRHFDAEPIFIDTMLNDYTIDLDKLDDYLKNNNVKKLRCMIVSFVGGNIPDLDRLYEIKTKYNITLIEDATTALGAMHNDKMIGSMESDMTIFSITNSKDKNTLSKGGFIVTSNSHIAKRAILLRNHAISYGHDSNNQPNYIYDVTDIGYQYSMSQAEAALNVEQFYKTNESCDRRIDIAKLYDEELKNVRHVSLLEHSDEYIYTSYIVKIHKNRDAFSRALKDYGIQTKLEYIPLHLLSYYKKKYKLKITEFPNALSNYGQILSLPIYPSLDNDEVKYICDKIIKISKEWV